MKAAVMYPLNDLPGYEDFPSPRAERPDELLVSVRAVALKHFDKSRASGKHYSSDSPRENGRVIGGDGVFVLEDGSRVYALGLSGTMAEQAVIDRTRMVPVPDGLGDACAAAIPNAVMGSAMGLRFKADIRPGDKVLVNGATGFTGRVAVQIAKHYGAGKIIATGRNHGSLKELLSLGASSVISLVGSEEEIMSSLAAVGPVDVVIDYLWGHSAELILRVMKGKGGFSNKIRYVSVGSMTGDLIQLSAAGLRSVNLQLTGSGLGAWTREEVGKLFRDILPEMYQLALSGGLTVKTTTVSLPDVAELWAKDVPDGARLVVTI
jgi:NADPH:quinone reductase-like Zn-dependent oxidoreductase